MVCDFNLIVYTVLKLSYCSDGIRDKRLVHTHMLHPFHHLEVGSTIQARILKIQKKSNHDDRFTALILRFLLLIVIIHIHLYYSGTTDKPSLSLMVGSVNDNGSTGMFIFGKLST